MFLGLLNRVKKDLVRTHLHCIAWSPINEWSTRTMGETGQAFAHL